MIRMPKANLSPVHAGDIADEIDTQVTIIMNDAALVRALVNEHVIGVNISARRAEIEHLKNMRNEMRALAVRVSRSRQSKYDSSAE